MLFILIYVYLYNVSQIKWGKHFNIDQFYNIYTAVDKDKGKAS